MASTITHVNRNMEKETRRKFPKIKWERWNNYYLNKWLLEVLAVVFSTACFLTICGILLAFGDNTRPKLPYNLSLNAIISVLATGCKTSLLFMIREVLSQTKWTWFRGAPRPLLEMQAFDSASRGPFGSLKMLFRKKQSIASFGAGIVVLLLAFDPFIQQVVRYSTRSAPVSDGTGVAVTKRLKYFVPVSSDLTEFQRIFPWGIWTADDHSFRPTCSSGNCIWPTFRSLGLCSQCMDITTSMTLECHEGPRVNTTFLNKWSQEIGMKGYNATCRLTPKLGQSVNFSTQFIFKTMEDGGNWVEFPRDTVWHVYSSFEDNLAKIQQLDNLSFVGTTNPMSVSAHARLGYHSGYFNSSDPIQGLKVENVTECSFALCLGSYETSTIQGTTVTKTLDVDYGHLFWRNAPLWAPLWPNNTQNRLVNRTLCWRPTASPLNPNFFERTERSAASTLTQLSPVEFAYCGVQQIPVGDLSYVGSYWVDHFEGDSGEWVDLPTKNSDSSIGHIGRVGLELPMSNVATYLNRMALRADGEDVYGTAHTIESVVIAQWLWLIFPGLLVLCGILFFILGLLANKKAMISPWKSSVTAYFYHGLEDVGPGDYTTSGKMERKAGITNVQLLSSDEAGDLKLKGRTTVLT